MERDVVAAFNAELASIYESRPPISKNKIVEITKAALKAIKFYKHVVFSVEKFLGKCKAEYKIPCLYVMDSILRQSKRQFKDKDVFCARFAKNFDTTLVVLLQCSPSDRLKIARTINLWEANGVFSSDKINEYRAICVANGLEMNRDEVEKAVKGEKADLSIYERSGEKEKKERHHRHKDDSEIHSPKAEPVVEGPSDEIPPGGVSEAALLTIIQNQMFDMGRTVERDLTLLRQIHSMVVQSVKERVETQRNVNKQVSVKKLLSSGFDYSDEEDNEEEKEEPKALPPPTQEELDKLAEAIVMEKAMEIRSMHGERIVKLQNAALEAKRAEVQKVKAVQDAIAQKEKDAAVAQAQKMAAQQQAAAQQHAAQQHAAAQQQVAAHQQAAAAAAAASAVSSQSSILGKPPPGPSPFGLPPGMQLPPGFPGLPQVSMGGQGGLSGLIQQNSLDNQIKALNSILSNPLGILGQGPPPPLNLQHNHLLRMNPQLAALAAGGGADLQALLSQPPPSLPPGMGMPPPGLSQQQLQQLAGVGNGMGLGLGGSIPTSMNGPPPGGMTMTGMHPQSMQKPPSLMDLDQDVLAQMMAQAPPSNEMEDHSMERRESREEERDRRKKRDGERDRGDRGDRRERDRDRDRSDHRSSRDHKEKKRKRSRSRERRDRSREREDDKERRKMGLPSHPKDGTTTIASCTVWLGRLPQMNEDELRTSISEFASASASQVQLMPTRACAYVTMRDRRSAVKLLEKSKGMRVKGKEIKSSWAAGNGTKGDKWRSYWDEDRGVSAIPHNELPLDAMNHLCDGGWLDTTTLPVHLRGIIDDAGKVIDQSSSGTSLLDDASLSHHSNSFIDLGQVQLPPTPDLSSIPNPMSHFNPNMNLGGPALMMPPMGGQLSGQFVGLGLPNGLPPFVPSPMRGGMRGRGGPPGGPGGFMHSPMGGRGRGGGDWRGGGRGGGFVQRGGGRGGWNGGPPPMDRLPAGGGFGEPRRNTRWNTDDATVSSTTMNDDHDRPRINDSNDHHPTKIDHNSDDMEME